MKLLIVAVALFTICSAASDADWARFQATYGKAYRSFDEVTSRRIAWEHNWAKINKHNEEYASGLHTYTLGENQFADMVYFLILIFFFCKIKFNFNCKQTYDEFAATHLGLNPATVNQMKTLEQHQVMESRAASYIGKN